MNLSLLRILLLLSVTEIPALAEPREPHPIRCDFSRVQRCQEDHRVAGDQARLGGNSLDPELQVLSRKIDEQKSPKESCEVQLRAFDDEKILLDAEVAFLELGARKKSAEIFPGFPSLEDFFLLHPLQKSWLERFPTERMALLTTRLLELQTERSNLSRVCAQISTEFRRLNDEYQSLNTRKANLLAEAARHVAMCERGCLEEICPPREN